MVSILLISHSSKVADGARDIAAEMAGNDVVIVACGGTADGRIGTDPDRVARAVDALAFGDGLVILADLGSSVMSAQMAVESLPEERRAKVIIANAPIVEGAVLAAIEASMGRSLAEVDKAAQSAHTMTKA
ncbi:MAG: dihydroxyacetone kinase phosphoryl donor subunit DhaM [Firmicutes bacterium]|jgi:dihydroxyacetone kinase phosphotransfer subunit|nr:dihydroxyacetone kinase phosphoryl donor subunit DhaM [Bacillota bacterium]